MHHVSMTTHWSIFIYASYQWSIFINWFPLGNLSFSSRASYQWSIFINWFPLGHLSFSSRAYSLFINHQSINYLTSINDINQTKPFTSMTYDPTISQIIKPLASMTTWSNNIPLWHWWKYQHWCQLQLPIIDVKM